MDTVFLQKHTQKLSLKDGQLILSENDKVLETYPICATETVSVCGNAQITTQAIKECLKEGVRINYFNTCGKYLGRLEPGFPKNVMRRLTQYKIFLSDELRLEWAKALVSAKIQGEIVEIRRLNEQNISFPYKEIKNELKDLKERIKSAENSSVLLGIEGMAARSYFSIFPFVLPHDIPWNGRSYHPAKDGINEILSIIYGITAQQLRMKTEEFSLDPHCSMLHEPGYGRGGLAYDLLEIFRAVFCDHTALRLIRKDKEIRRAAGIQDLTDFSENIRNAVCRYTRDAMQKKYRLQKSFPDRLFAEACRLTAGGITSGTVPDFEKLIPER